MVTLGPNSLAWQMAILLAGLGLCLLGAVVPWFIMAWRELGALDPPAVDPRPAAWYAAHSSELGETALMPEPVSVALAEMWAEAAPWIKEGPA